MGEGSLSAYILFSSLFGASISATIFAIANAGKSTAEIEEMSCGTKGELARVRSNVGSKTRLTMAMISRVGL